MQGKPTSSTPDSPATLEAFVRTGVPFEPVRPNRLYRQLVEVMRIVRLEQESVIHASLEAIGACSATLAPSDVLAIQAQLRLLIDETMAHDERPFVHSRLDHMLLELTR